MFEAWKLLEAYDNQKQNEKLKQTEDSVHSNIESLYKMRLSGRLYIEKRKYGPLIFDIEDIQDRYNLRIDEHGRWAVSAVNEKEKCYRIFHQPAVDPVLLEKSQEAQIAYYQLRLPLEGLSACLFSILTHNM